MKGTDLCGMGLILDDKGTYLVHLSFSLHWNSTFWKTLTYEIAENTHSEPYPYNNQILRTAETIVPLNFKPSDSFILLIKDDYI